MIEITKIASGSTGNCYYLEDEKIAILIECGVNYSTIFRHLGTDKLRKVSACFISHEHNDHSKCWEDLILFGKRCYMTKGTFSSLSAKTDRSINQHYIRKIDPFSIFWIERTWQCMAFTTEHDAREPVGFLIQTKEAKILYATDTYFLRYKIKDLTHIMIECNYVQKILDENVQAGTVSADLRNRIMRSHLSLEQLKAFLEANDLSKLREIMLIHPSRRNLDIDRAIEEVKELTGKPVYA